MSRRALALALVPVTLAVATAIAHADPAATSTGGAAAAAGTATAKVPAHDTGDTTQLGFWFGPRVFNDDSLLGYIDDAPHHLMLSNSIELGVRAARPFFPWLVPELELGVRADPHHRRSTPTSTGSSRACTSASS